MIANATPTDDPTTDDNSVLAGLAAEVAAERQYDESGVGDFLRLWADELDLPIYLRGAINTASHARGWPVPFPGQPEIWAFADF